MSLSPTLQKLTNILGPTKNAKPVIEAIQWQEGMDITLHVSGDSLTLLAKIIELRTDPKDDILLRKLLTHTFPGLRLRRGALTINPDESALVFSYEHDFHLLDKARFESLLANFAETAQELRDTATHFRFN
ncbi:CesT family type III secretion system chaperone [Pseudomonas coronafaciens]|uniref:CesT family type III secretion system chaperone n=1 Tax=Pseudomonas coronafaciens TaxID=53409 RepID=UPI0037A39453